MTKTFPVLTFNGTTMAKWMAAENMSPFNGEYPQMIQTRAATYELSEWNDNVAVYYPMLDAQEQLIDAEEFFQELCAIMHGKGFNVGGDMAVSPNTKTDGRTFNATVYYGLDDDRKNLYTQGCFYYADLAHMYKRREEKMQAAHNVKTEKEMRLGKMLDMIAEVQEMAEDFSIPADFINPLTAMAEQLRTNIIEHKPNAETVEALRDAQSGNVTRVDKVDDLFAPLPGDENIKF